MFTINIYLRFFLIALGLIGGVLLAIFYGFWYSFPFLLLGIIMLVGYFLFGTVQSAAALFQKMDIEGAEKRLGLTFKESMLFRPNRAYFNLVKGTIALQKKDMEEGERLFLRAKEIGLEGDNEKGMVDLQLASLAANKQKWTLAKNYYKELANYKITEPELKAQIKEFDKAIKNRGVMKASNRGRSFQPGGKRRRPRMR